MNQFKYERVIIIGIDGLGRNVKTKNIDAFIKSGASSLNAEAVKPTDSAENWGSILHGVEPDKHGCKNGDIEAGKTYDEDSKFPSIFKILNDHDKIIQMASFVSWSPINSGIVENSVKMFKYSPLTNENIFYKVWLRIKHHILKIPNYDDLLKLRLLEYIRDPKYEMTKFLFIHLTDVDEYGHIYGFTSKEYFTQIEKLDLQIQDILAAIDAKWKDNTLIIMTTDHGGIGKTHGDDSNEELGVFLACRGKGIKQNTIIKSKISNMDTAAITMIALNEKIPYWFDSKVPEEL